MLEVNFSPFPVLETERLLLRKTELSDAEALFAIRSDANVMRYIPRPVAQRIEEIHELIEKIDGNITANNGINWGIELKDTGAFVGFIGFHILMKEDYRAEFGYMLHPAQHSKGIMKEAVRAVISFGFEHMRLNSIEAHTDPDNVASRKVLERNGFVQEGHLRQNCYWNGVFSDTVIYSLLAADHK
jgi:ribosomal-protein-alanine N-acetyltransferase